MTCDERYIHSFTKKVKQRAESEVNGESKMLKFIRGKGQQPTAERQKLQKDLFAFRKVRKREREKDTFALVKKFSPTPGARMGAG